MKKTIIFGLLLLVGAGAQHVAAQDDRGFEIAKNLEIFSAVYKNLNLNYVDDVDPGKTIKVPQTNTQLKVFYERLYSCHNVLLRKVTNSLSNVGVLDAEFY